MLERDAGLAARCRFNAAPTHSLCSIDRREALLQIDSFRVNFVFVVAFSSPRGAATRCLKVLLGVSSAVRENGGVFLLQGYEIMARWHNILDPFRSFLVSLDRLALSFFDPKMYIS